MHIIENDRSRLLKTKIVATVGPKRGGIQVIFNQDGQPEEKRDEIFDPEGGPIREQVPTGKLLEWFILAGVDVIRLNMSFASIQETYGGVEKEVLDWVYQNRDGSPDTLQFSETCPALKLGSEYKQNGSGIAETSFGSISESRLALHPRKLALLC